jgi:hypothetical protein
MTVQYKPTERALDLSKRPHPDLVLQIVGGASKLLDRFFGTGMDIRAEVRKILTEEYEVDLDSADTVLKRYDEILRREGLNYGETGTADEVAERIYSRQDLWDA